MILTPALCPHCGELLLGWTMGDNTVVLPEHPDRIAPAEHCSTSVANLASRTRH
jgi:hypothetical protein